MNNQNEDNGIYKVGIVAIIAIACVGIASVIFRPGPVIEIKRTEQPDITEENSPTKVPHVQVESGEPFTVKNSWGDPKVYTIAPVTFTNKAEPMGAKEVVGK